MTVHKSIPPQQVVNGMSINADLSKGPFFIDGCDTLPKLFLERCKELGERTAHREKDYGIWLSYSWNDFREHARLIGLGLHRLGLKPGEVVSILSEDNKEWVYADMGVQGMGGICSGVYTTDSPSQLRYLMDDSGSKFLIVENDEQLDKFLEIKAQVPGVEKVIVLDDEGLHGFSDDRVIFLDDLYRLGREQLKETPDLFEAEVARSTPEDLAILVYTSGTTGNPKGAMISHRNILLGIDVQSREVYRQNDTDQRPCSHVDQRARAQEDLPVKVTHQMAELASFVANMAWIDVAGPGIGGNCHVVIVVAQGGIGNQSAFPAQLVHDAVAGVDAQCTGNAFKLLAIANVDAGRAYRDAGVAVDAITQNKSCCGSFLGAFAARFSSPVIVGDDQ